MLSEVFEIFSGGVGIISVVLSLFRGFERFLLRGGDIFREINFYFHVHIARLNFASVGFEAFS